MLNLEAVPRHYDDAVALLANWHREGTGFAAYSFPDPEGVVVRLVEVSDRFPTLNAVRPIQFGRTLDFPFPSAVALLSAEDWANVQQGLLLLPSDWLLQDVQRVQIDDPE